MHCIICVCECGKLNYCRREIDKSFPTLQLYVPKGLEYLMPLGSTRDHSFLWYLYQIGFNQEIETV